MNFLPISKSPQNMFALSLCTSHFYPCILTHPTLGFKILHILQNGAYMQSFCDICSNYYCQSCASMRLYFFKIIIIATTNYFDILVIISLVSTRDCNHCERRNYSTHFTLLQCNNSNVEWMKRKYIYYLSQTITESIWFYTIKYLLEVNKTENNYGNYMYFKRTSYILFRDEMMLTSRWFIMNSLEDWRMYQNSSLGSH